MTPQPGPNCAVSLAGSFLAVSEPLAINLLLQYFQEQISGAAVLFPLSSVFLASGALTQVLA